MYILASVNVGFVSPIIQPWRLFGFPERPYIVLSENKVDGNNREIRLYLELAQIEHDPLGRKGWYFYRGELDYLKSVDTGL